MDLERETIEKINKILSRYGLNLNRYKSGYVVTHLESDDVWADSVSVSSIMTSIERLISIAEDSKARDRASAVHARLRRLR